MKYINLKNAFPHQCELKDINIFIYKMALIFAKPCKNIYGYDYISSMAKNVIQKGDSWKLTTFYHWSILYGNIKK